MYANYSQCQCRSAPLIYSLVLTHLPAGIVHIITPLMAIEFYKQSFYQIGRNKWPFAFFSNNFLRVLTCCFFRRLALPRAARLIWRSNFTALHNAKKVSFLNASHIISFQLQYQWQKFIHACRTEVNWVSLGPKQQVKWYIPDLQYWSVHDEYTFVIYSYGSKITFSARKCILYKRYIWCTLKDGKIERNVEN